MSTHYHLPAETFQSTDVPVHSSGSAPTVYRIDDGARDLWDGYAQRSPAASIYHRYAWRGVLQDVFSLKTYYLAAMVDDHVCGLLPLARQKSRFFGDFLVSLPYFNYGGIVCDDPSVRDALLREADKLARELRVEHVELRHTDSELALPARTDKVSMLLDLPDSQEALLSGLRAKVRAHIKRPEREGITCRSGGIELTRDFYVVFARNMRDLGTPVYPIRFFEEIMRRFETQARLFVADLGGKPVAAALVLGHNGTLEIPWASSLREVNALGVNMYLYWRVLSWAIEAGYQTFDFGRCTQDSGTYRFKKQWGSRPLQLTWHYLLYGSDQLPQINHGNPKYQVLVKLWQKQPVALANALSPLLARHLP